MKKIAILGCPGAGKSTFARSLHNITGIPLFHLDMIWHKPDKTTVTREDFDRKLREIFAEDQWIIDGNYSRTAEMRIKESDTVFLFDIPIDVCLEGAAERIGKKRPDMPWVEEEFDPEFKQWIMDFPKNDLPKIYDIVNKYTNEKKVIIFGSREEADEYLNGLCKGVN